MLPRDGTSIPLFIGKSVITYPSFPSSSDIEHSIYIPAPLFTPPTPCLSCLLRFKSCHSRSSITQALSSTTSHQPPPLRHEEPSLLQLLCDGSKSYRLEALYIRDSGAASAVTRTHWTWCRKHQLPSPTRHNKDQVLCCTRITYQVLRPTSQAAYRAH